jgi:tetratricopeptide (TPR) repeat protein
MKMLRCVVLLLFVPCYFLMPQSTSSETAVLRTVDTGTLLFLFQHQLYKPLTAKLEEWQNLFEQDFRNEENVVSAFEVFFVANRSYEQMINAWIEQFPNSFAPYIARAEYYHACGWHARGHAWASETTDKQFQEMERYFSLALQDIKTALQQNPKIDVCYSIMINIAMTVGNDVLKKNALAASIQHNPYGYKTRSVYLHTLTPRWGGSYRQMEEFVKDAEQHLSHNPALKELEAASIVDKAEVCELDQSYYEALAFYRQALKIKNRASYHAGCGNCYIRMKDYHNALEEYNEAIALKQNYAEYLYKKASILFSLHRLRESQEMNEQAELLDPNDDYIQKQKEYLESNVVQGSDHGRKGYELLEQQRYEEAITELNEAMRYDDRNHLYYYNRAVCYLDLGKYDEAISDFQNCIQRKRNYPEVYKALANAYYHHAKYDEALDAINMFISLVPNNAEAYYNRAVVLNKEGKISQACYDAKQACEMGFQSGCKMYEELKKE